MSFILFTVLQIFKIAMKLTIQPASVEAVRAFSAGGLFAKNPRLVCTTPQSMRLLHRKCVAEAVNIKNAWFSSYTQRWL